MIRTANFQSAQLVTTMYTNVTLKPCCMLRRLIIMYGLMLLRKISTNKHSFCFEVLAEEHYVLELTLITLTLDYILT